jgi:hypothetical protein
MSEVKAFVVATSPRGPRCIIALLAFLLAMGACWGHEEVYETCRICGSTRKLDATAEQILYRASRFDHGAHDWESGISDAVRSPVPDGTVVLVKRVPPDSEHPVYGPFVLTEQRLTRAEWSSDPSRSRGPDPRRVRDISTMTLLRTCQQSDTRPICV